MVSEASPARKPVHLAGLASPATWGLLLVILTEGIFFSLLFVSYFYLRNQAEAWPLGDIKPPELLVPSINTVILLSSSLPMFWAEWGIRNGKQGVLRAGLAMSFILGISFLSLQGYEYSTLEFKASENAYASIFYTIITFHATHVFAGLLLMAFTQLRAWAGHFDPERHLAVQNVAWYWHFVDAVWIFIFSFVYISPQFS